MLGAKVIRCLGGVSLEGDSFNSLTPVLATVASKLELRLTPVLATVANLRFGIFYWSKGCNRCNSEWGTNCTVISLEFETIYNSLE